MFSFSSRFISVVLNSSLLFSLNTFAASNYKKVSTIEIKIQILKFAFEHRASYRVLLRCEYLCTFVFFSK